MSTSALGLLAAGLNGRRPQCASRHHAVSWITKKPIASFPASLFNKHGCALTPNAETRGSYNPELSQGDIDVRSCLLGSTLCWQQPGPHSLCSSSLSLPLLPLLLLLLPLYLKRPAIFPACRFRRRWSAGSATPTMWLQVGALGEGWRTHQLGTAQ